MEVFIQFLLVMCWCFNPQNAINLYGHRTEGWARKSPDCQSQINPVALNKIFKNLYKDLERVPFCACVQICVNHPVYCYPNGCLKTQLMNVRKDPKDKGGSFGMGRDYPSRIGAFNDIEKIGVKVKGGGDDLGGVSAATIKPESLQKLTYLHDKRTLQENNRTRFTVTVGEKLRKTNFGGLNQKLDKKSKKIGKIWTRHQSMTQQPFRYKVLNQFLPKSETKVITIAILPKPSDYLKKREKSQADAPTIGNSFYFVERKLKTSGRNTTTAKDLEDFLEKTSMKDFFVKRMNTSIPENFLQHGSS